jgi:sterol desaturase/sphingolipid hydroxylase (fatty acid hydroxylase superfamily)
VDLTVIAIPAYLGGMGAEYAWSRRHAAERGPSPGDYERDDTLASLAMGAGSLVAPLVMNKLLHPVTPGRGRYGKVLVASAVGAAVVATAADVLSRRGDAPLGPAGVVPPAAPTGALGPARAVDERDDVANPGRARRRRMARSVRQVASSVGTTAVAAGGLAVATAWAHRTAGRRLWDKRVFADKGDGPLAVLGAVLAWDFIYYWNHRLAHESRWLWAAHVVHHSSERYNLSTALRQPVADAVTVSVPYGLLALLGYRPDVIETARGVNLLYQFWVHTEAIGSMGPLEKVLNSPSAHRVHHGSNRQYLDRNHGSILIIWDRLFGTFEPEGDEVVYGLTRNIDSFNPARIATHEWSDILRDVHRSDTWGDRFGFVLRGPGWAYARDAARGEPAAAGAA